MAVRRRVRIHQVAAAGRPIDVGPEELDARLQIRRVDVEQLARLADDQSVCEAGGKHPAHEVSERGDAVHEDPESRHLVGADQDTAEDQAQGEEKVSEVAAGLGGIHSGNDHGGECGCKHEEGPDEEEHETSSLGELVGWVLEGWVCVAVHSDRPVVGGIEYYGHQTVPWKFDNNVGEDEHLPGICLGWAFTDFIQGALSDLKCQLCFLGWMGEVLTK